MSGTVKLPPPSPDGPMVLEAAMAARRSVRDYAPRPLTLEHVSQLLWAAQGITRGGGGRAAPSAGALYPLEVLAAVSNVEGLEPGIYRYVPDGHQLGLSRKGAAGAEIAAGALGQGWLAGAPLILVLAGVEERMSWKYYERTGRYTLIEAGHAAQNVLLQAAALGLGAAPAGAFRDEALKRTVGLGEEEEPLYIIAAGFEKA